MPVRILPIKRVTETSRSNPKAIVTIPWEKRCTRNNKKLLTRINSITDHKFNEYYLDRFMDNDHEAVHGLWQDLNIMSTEFYLHNCYYGDSTCACSKQHINKIYVVRHKSGVDLTIGDCCINRVFPTLKQVDMFALGNRIIKSIEQHQYPMLLLHYRKMDRTYRELFSEVFNVIDPQEHDAFTKRATSQKVYKYRTDYYASIEPSYHWFIATYLRKMKRNDLVIQLHILRSDADRQCERYIPLLDIPR